MKNLIELSYIYYTHNVKFIKSQFKKVKKLKCSNGAMQMAKKVCCILDRKLSEIVVNLIKTDITFV